MTGRRALAAAVLAALSVAGCTMPVTDDASYRREARVNASTLLSAVRTGAMAARLWQDGSSLPTHLETAVSESENDARSAADAFAGLQPPTRRSDPLHEELDALATGAGSALADLRIALRREDGSGVAQARDELTGLGVRLESVEESLR